MREAKTWVDRLLAASMLVDKKLGFSSFQLKPVATSFSHFNITTKPCTMLLKFNI